MPKPPRSFVVATFGLLLCAAFALTVITSRWPGGPPAPGALAASHAVRAVKVNAASAFVRLSPADGAVSLRHLLVGDLNGERAHWAWASEGGARGFLVSSQGRGQIMAVAPPAREVFPVIVSRQGRQAFVYLGASGPFPLGAPEGFMDIMCATDRPAGGEDGLRVEAHDTAAVDLRDDFMRERMGRGDAWTVGPGRWWIEQEAEVGAGPNAFTLMAQSRERPGRALTGNRFWHNYRLECSVDVDRGSEAGIAFACGDSVEPWRLLVRDDGSRGAVRLVGPADTDGGEGAGRRIASTAGRWVRLAVDVAEGRPVRAFLDGVAVADATANRPLFGRVGLWVRGDARFDDFAVVGLDQVGVADDLRPVLGASRTFKDKPPYPKDNRDEMLQRWASDTDAWSPVPRPGAGGLPGIVSSTTLFRDFRVLFAASSAGRALSLHAADGQRMIEVSLAKGEGMFERVGGDLCLDGRKVGELAPEKGVRVAMLGEGASRQPPPVLSRTVRQEFFETAPAGWVPVSGRWALTSRWRCKPVWNFFGGQGVDDVVLFGKARFHGSQTHEFYYGMKDIFGREFERRRYARHDVNFSFCTNGRDLASGYTLMFGAERNAATRLLKGDVVVAQNDRVKFEPFVDIDDLHLFWRRMRVEKLGRRVRALLDDEVIFDWEDAAADVPQGGHVALWTFRNGIVYARVNSSAEAVSNGAEEYCVDSGDAAAGGWASLDPARVRLRPGKDGRVRVENLFGGGTFAVRWDAPGPVDLSKMPVVRIPFRSGDGTRVNLHAVVNGRGMVLSVNGPVGETYRVLGAPSGYGPEWEPYAAEPLGRPAVGDRGFLDPVAGRIEVDLLADAGRRFGVTGEARLTSLVVGNTSNQGYLLAGFGGNASGTWYEVGPVEFCPRP